jgi:hypothetical protein
MGMAYDSARGQVVLFGGDAGGTFLGDTWTWDGTDWMQQAPAHSPLPRVGTGMAYDAVAAQMVLFGGDYIGTYLGDTWTWDGTDWTQHPAGSIALTPQSGPPGTVVRVIGSGFAAGELVRLTFVDSTQGRVFLKRVSTGATGAFSTHVTVPLDATPGRQHVKANGSAGAAIAKRSFIVTVAR